MTPHWRIHNTALAAALATLGVPLDPTEPYSRLIDTGTDREQLVFLFRDVSDTDKTRRTEEIVAAWEHRPQFEIKFPSHPLVPMRAVHDARTALIKVIHGAELPTVREFKGEKFETAILTEAAILRAHGFPLIVFTGRAFSFPLAWKTVNARQIVAESQRAIGAKASQWQARYLANLSKFLAVTKCTPTLATREDDRVALFSADMSTKEQDRWLDML